MKKIGLLCLALVLALGALGVGYAAWTDTITIDGTVNTGSVDLEIIDTSNTWVYKVVDNGDYPNEIAIIHTLDSENPSEPPQGPAGTTELVSFADADDTSTTGHKEVTITIDNAFPLGDNPCDWLCADIILHYNGSIPVIADAELTNFTGDALLENVAIVLFFELTKDASSGEYILGQEITGPVQLHYCDYVWAILCLDIPQEDQYMNLSGTFTAELTVVQWNEYPLAP